MQQFLIRWLRVYKNKLYFIQNLKYSFSQHDFCNTLLAVQ